MLAPISLRAIRVSGWWLGCRPPSRTSAGATWRRLAFAGWAVRCSYFAFFSQSWRLSPWRVFLRTQGLRIWKENFSWFSQFLLIFLHFLEKVIFLPHMFSARSCWSSERRLMSSSSFSGLGVPEKCSGSLQWVVSDLHNSQHAPVTLSCFWENNFPKKMV